MTSVTGADIRAGFERLGLIGKRVVVHSSLRSFGNVIGGVDTVVTEMINSFETILVPAFCWDSNAPPPPHDRPEQNGCDYSFYEGWTKPLKPFIVESAGIEPKMGIISRKFVSLPLSRRSAHAWHSWVAWGSMAEQLVENHSWETTNLPLERLANLDGQLLLMGVGLSSCTAIHIAEERAGRRPFIRWATDRNGEVKRVRAAGCAKGFDKLIPYCCRELFSETYVGDCRILSTPLEPFIEHMVKVISSHRELTPCSDTCLRCRDVLLGGPLV
ncbi:MULTISPECIES: AAC(3) family N-acetyltransferase [unclassified Microcoleus]